MEISTNDLAPTISRKGRRFTAQQRQDLLQRVEKSGLTQREFAAREKICLSTLNRWRRQQRRAAVPRAQRVQFQELIPSSPELRWALEVVSPRNWTVRLASPPEPGVLEPLLRALPC